MVETGGTGSGGTAKAGTVLVVIGLVVGFVVGFGGGWFLKPAGTGPQGPAPLYEDLVPSGYAKQFTVTVNGTTYTFPALPGHYWKVSGDRIYGFHFQAGPPDGTWKWSTDAPDGILLYVTSGILGNCTAGYTDPQYAELKAEGYVHFHQVIGSTGMAVGYWLTHIAVTSFTFQGPPGNPHSGEPVNPGLDPKFPNVCEGP